MNESLAVVDILNSAKTECYSKINATFINDNWCKLIFDGLVCWPPTPPSTQANQSCANDYLKPTNNGTITKQCDQNGKWFKLGDAAESWTNFSDCGQLFVVKEIKNEFINLDIYTRWIPIIKSVTQLGYILSIISLVISLFIFLYIKRLRCARNKLHTHLFISFIIRALMALLKDGLFVRGTALSQDVVYLNGQAQFNKDSYSWICKAIISTRNYFIITNYIFVLMEGMYLHNLLFLKLFSESGVLIYCIFGWCFPIFFIIPWIVLKIIKEDSYCWTLKSDIYIDLLIQIPIGGSVIINFVLFTIIMRVLFIKLSSMYTHQAKIKYQKLLKATLTLMPLFGVPYTLSIMLQIPAKRSPTFEILWLFFAQSFIAFHGLFASLAYCILNNEVQVEVVRKYKFLKDRNNQQTKRRNRTISHTTQVQLNEDLQELNILEMKTDQL